MSLSSKVVGMREAITAHVHDGDTVVIEGFTHLICFAAGHEIIRQGRRNLTLCRLTPEGRKRFLEYVATLEKVVSDAADVARQSRSVRLPAPEGFSPA